MCSISKHDVYIIAWQGILTFVFLNFFTHDWWSWDVWNKKVRNFIPYTSLIYCSMLSWCPNKPLNYFHFFCFIIYPQKQEAANNTIGISTYQFDNVLHICMWVDMSFNLFVSEMKIRILSFNMLYAFNLEQMLSVLMPLSLLPGNEGYLLA